MNVNKEYSVEWFKEIYKDNPKWLGTQARKLLGHYLELEKDLETVWVAFEVHCAGGSGGNPLLCAEADKVAERRGFDWDLVDKHEAALVTKEESK